MEFLEVAEILEVVEHFEDERIVREVVFSVNSLVGVWLADGSRTWNGRVQAVCWFKANEFTVCSKFQYLSIATAKNSRNVRLIV